MRNILEIILEIINNFLLVGMRTNSEKLGQMIVCLDEYYVCKSMGVCKIFRNEYEYKIE